MCTGKGLNRRRFLGLVPGFAAVYGLGACSSEETGPGQIRWGKEACEYCGMIVDDPRFAGQVRGGPKRKLYKFDDFGDAVLWLAKQPFGDDPATEIWVGDSDLDPTKGPKWLDARKAFYIYGRKSPMAHNYGAVAVQTEGAIDFAALRKTILERGSTSRCETPEQGST